jgi:NAD(P)-dependent dehydrogenase (short-subunit alcohol dehydrogenase family)
MRLKNFLNLDEHFNGFLSGKVCVVTGAGSGLGKAIALGLPFAGVKVGVLDIDAKAVNETMDKIESEFSGFAFPMVASVSDETALGKVYSGMKKKFGKIDMLINCAGIAELGSIESLKEKETKKTIEVNLVGYFLNASIASRMMIEQKKGGNIINISSASARATSNDSSLYAITKEAQCMMARSWALDLGKHGIRVNAILPGDLYGNEELGIRSGIWNQAYFEKKAVDKELVNKNDSRLGGKSLNPEIKRLVVDFYGKRTTLGKEVQYKDILAMILFLCSESASNITGESISISSGNPAAFSR